MVKLLKEIFHDAIEHGTPDQLREKPQNRVLVPERVVLTVISIQAIVFLVAFIGLTVWSLLFTFTVETLVSDVVKPLPYTCNVLSPRNTMLAFNTSSSESAHYSTATETTTSCAANLRRVSNNCDPKIMGYNVLSVFGACVVVVCATPPRETFP